MIRYKLTSGTQVREEDFGLLFYAMEGPRLIFIASGDLLNRHFFEGTFTLDQWIEKTCGEKPLPTSKVAALKRALNRLKDQGLIFEC